jgi:hypothetical protein
MFQLIPELLFLDNRIMSVHRNSDSLFAEYFV